ncbi:Delta(1)-pyrroline-2-carboxylate reductase 1 [Paraburkholderia domus]|jgi:1-piperideine-2-carboxylate/1-pyrroline-2-carboxylate reductase [NAD(P)H]|uniref:Delta(1)-pyrroline-2-carboxylate reductase 1 n=1 Tax=Paraburkholderia domus TaxID=2793075 RepID=A0A9N8MQ32_9BURK|nr:bifunctional Delta(1)-pyrroline-2-carboxylate/Delta(1)-piperideine-2-carboxylate reductase [Paraburkholderia domus]MBK5051514.1 delta(1)-pyrroline-2-carboxylate reductase family protein [Burkholderia sp. R-70006]MBK5063633.1 delta(1)-pyrroline-2-carboxylate reductase family protein [Burkholderia sp. R-70199]MBK5089654.1 delta(1)-pyrroline-2-carboxylate reductase family protein [Burkholderia sp. R-69927]MBK5122881.1 delta(1)-pyrroline-2-carboxylate reductase family protein [Burkholderia sp. R
MTRPTTQIFDAAATARLIPYPTLVDTLKRASIDYAQQRIVSPERLVVPLNEGGIMLSMPATAPDLAIHKLVNVCASNGPRGIPTIHGQVMAFDADTGETLFILDGPTVTGRRTAAMSMLGVHTFAPARPHEFLLIGTGTQAVNHLEAIGELFPDARVWVKGSAPARAEAFCAAHGTRGAHGGKARELQPLTDPDGNIPDSIDVVIALTTSKQAVYDEAARADRLVIGVGAFTPAMVEIGARTIAGSALFVDDEAGARHEAGDFIQAGVDWAQVGGIAAVVENATLLPPGKPLVFKSVGCAAWDLAACRVAREALSGG